MGDLQKLRILVATNTPLTAEFGAGQVAINFAEALRELGHDITLWSPHPLPEQTKWWQSQHRMRQAINKFLDDHQAFDIIDSPSTLITNRMQNTAAVIVARSVQPDIQYIIQSITDCGHKGLIGSIKYVARYIFYIYTVLLILKGWSRATWILCLGSLEYGSMQKWFPWWRKKLIIYFNTLRTSEQKELALIRKYRAYPLNDQLKFLWIGRWVPHKGTDLLVDFIRHRLATHPRDTFTIAGFRDNLVNDFPCDLCHSPCLNFIPSFDRHYLYELLANHDVGLFTSLSEGWGLILNEMLESGMPVLATKAGGVPDLKPFFNHKIQPLSATFNFSGFTNTPSYFPSNYYQFFTWNHIVKKYLNDILIKQQQ